MSGRRSFSTKRKLAAYDGSQSAPLIWGSATYGGNPEHKTRPGDYGLTPPASPRPGKTLCDALRPVPRAEALALLRSGFQRGMVSKHHKGDWPQNVWAVDNSGEAYEAQLENREVGAYHGYPMPQDDPFRATILKEWARRAG